MHPTLTKTITFALLHFGVAFTVTYLLSGSVVIATGVGLLEPIANTIVFYFHERAWRRHESRAGTGDCNRDAPAAGVAQAATASRPVHACCAIVRPG